jgi:serine protease
MKKIFPLLFLLSSMIAFSQNKVEIVEGSILVQVSNEASLLRMIDENQFLDNKASRLQPKQQLSATLNIWELSFDFNAHSHERMLEKIQSDPDCKAAQLNKIIKKRNTVPNDPNFNSQWQYLNNGVNGALADADIDADLAWDISTGGLTVLGDTIVACVIDDGLDLTHADLRENRWYNWDEIPSNGIDDDGNGYIDDFNGWDAYNNNDIISGGSFGASHGTSVAGIVGAKGNNNIGVTGVNWNVKMMIVVGGGNEAEAIAAYEYPLRMRRLYNQSNGQLGAFVVCTNASWGVDNALASTAPLWCAIYDSLGAAGILNAGATANLNVNVDVLGDLPTHCPSNFLISVTNSNSADQKISQAGYGANSIDLAAPGNGAYTTGLPNTYVSFSGTSAATPHVCGAIALLYSVPCARLVVQARQDPAGTALLVKNYIMNGVDTLIGLQGITVTGGRLNIHKSMLLALQSGCAISGCYAPYGLSSSSVSDSSALLSWIGVPDASLGYQLRYREIGTGIWNNLLSNDTFLLVNGLTPCSNYEWQLQGDCDTALSTYSNTNVFSTGNCCIAPNQINLDTADISFAILNWNADSSINSYQVQYKIESDTIWTVLFNNGNFVTLNNLDSCSYYEIRVQSICDVNNNNLFSPTLRFRTKGCGTCVDLPYCAAKGNNSSFEWIDSVALNTLSSVSTDDGGYADFTDRGTTLNLGNSYPLSLRMNVGPNSNPNWRWKVWIDYNQDGVFDNINELAYNSGLITTNTLTMNGTINIPSTATIGQTRMRVGMKWGTTDLSSCAYFYYGEIEDYCVELTNNPSSINSLVDSEYLRIFPNPNNGILNIEFFRIERSEFEISDLNGRQLYRGQIQQGNNVVDLNFIPTGVYLLKVGEKVFKLVRI